MDRALGHATALRTVGRIFDADEARAVIIEERAESVWLSWDPRAGAGKTARYPWAEIDRLQRIEQIDRSQQMDRTAAALARMRQERQDARAWSELLRTLGQDLDEEAADTTTITGDLSWITASWVSAGKFMTRQYTAADLWEANRLRANLRQSYA
jgi:hypothetical protein